MGREAGMAICGEGGRDGYIWGGRLAWQYMGRDAVMAICGEGGWHDNMLGGRLA